MTAPIDLVLGRLRDRGSDPRTNGSGWTARCPAHDDTNPSLSVADGDDGTVLVRCHAGDGCDADKITAALGLDMKDLFPATSSNGQKPKPELVATYDYVNETGELLYQVCRMSPKSFRQRRPKPGGWVWKLGDVRRVPFQLPQVLEAVEAGRWVVVVEGEKDVATLAEHQITATCNSGGAGKWPKEFAAYLKGARVAVIPDNDPAGEKHAEQVASSLTGIAERVVRVAPLSKKPGGDVSDWLAEHEDPASAVGELKDLIRGGNVWEPAKDGAVDEPLDEPDAAKPERKSASTALVEIAQVLYRFGRSDAGEPYAIPREGPEVVALLRGGKSSLRAQLARHYFRATGRAAPQQALADALLVIEGLAQEAHEEHLHLRVARDGADVLVDLGDQTGRAIRVSIDGWRIETRMAVRFKRTALNAALPEPAQGGQLEDLWQWLNVATEDQPLVLAWLVAALIDGIPHPVLGLFGEQGTGKTTAQKVIVATIDPSPVPTRKPPRDAESWVTAAAGSWVVGIDNLSGIPDWLSDSLCRAVTGDGDVRRKLYTDGDHHVFAFRRCVILTGIDLGAVRGDLAERLLPIELDRIPDRDRAEEAVMWPAWERAHPQILGAVLDLAAGVLRVLPSVRLDTKPRMADFARVVAAVDEILGTTGLARYIATQGSLATDSLTGDEFLMAVQTVLDSTFTGTSAELLALVPAPERAPKGWPRNARAVTQLLRRQAPAMRRAGWTVDDDDARNKECVLRWTLHRPEKSGNPSLPSLPPLPEQPEAGQAGRAGMNRGQSQDDEASPAAAFDATLAGERGQ